MNRTATQAMQPYETAHWNSVRTMAPECMVLLKNDGTLPLKKIGKIALYGNGARRTLKGGTGSGDVNVRHFVTAEEGLRNAGFEITTNAWLDAYDTLVQESKAAYFQEVRRQADEFGANPLMMAMGRIAPEPEYELALNGEGDTAIYVLARVSGEGSDRHDTEGDIRLTKTETHDILALNEQYDHFVLVLNTGGMVDLSPVETVGTVLVMGQLGSAAGDALADVLTGKAYPSGKLTMSWAPIEQYPSTDGFGDPNGTDYTEGIYVGYRYFDTAGIKPSYEFGYGMGYTDFEIRDSRIFLTGETVTVTAEIVNIKDRPGKEVVQVYYSAPDGKLDQPYQALAGFAKTGELLPGETEKVEVHFAVSDMASYDVHRAAYVLEAGRYDIRVGNSSRNTRIAGAVRLEEEVITQQLRHVGGESGFTDRRPVRCGISYEEEEQEKESAPVWTVLTSEIDRREVTYGEEPGEIPSGMPCAWQEVLDGSRSLTDFLAGLTEEQLAWLCIGDYSDADDVLEIIGNASHSIAGAAGETTSRLGDLGLPGIVMADGPAGVRLSREYKIVDGAVKGSAPAGGDMLLVYTPEELASMMVVSEPSEEEKQAEVNYQNCTAIPIGTCIAQSWNEEIAKACGDLVGDEMERLDIRIWLAPAQNIQRSPLCGRNFEYYSEDPLLSGIMAAAVTNGVQQHSKTAVTIKHFACNNQETNRFFSNSSVGERALREIYLKGFEICVRKSAPRLVMTSYNLLNGVHACNRRDLLTDVLRDEWGFDGVVMTDWLVTGGMGASGEKWPCANAAGNIKAGNDLTMPGMPQDKEDILSALRTREHPYAITRGELQKCAGRILKMLWDLQ